MTVFLMFILELMTMRYAKFGIQEDDINPADRRPSKLPTNLELAPTDKPKMAESAHAHKSSHAPGFGEDHLSHADQHTDNADVTPDWQEFGIVPETYSAQLTAIFILEFGVIFHSVFVGLTLAVAGTEFVTLYIVLVFHQTFEGLGLGSRLATIPWPRSKRWTPYILASAYGLTTPVAIAIGLGIRQSWSPGSRTALLTNGSFDSISAGILLYTGLIELMAHEFMFSSEMRKAPIKVVLSAFALMVLGAGTSQLLQTCASKSATDSVPLGLMALLGYWA